jgi:hypothetical protein
MRTTIVSENIHGLEGRDLMPQLGMTKHSTSTWTLAEHAESTHRLQVLDHVIKSIEGGDIVMTRNRVGGRRLVEKDISNEHTQLVRQRLRGAMDRETVYVNRRG